MFYQFNHFGLSEHFAKESGENFSFPAHLHHSFEFITVFEGEMKVVVDGKEYIIHKGQGVLVFPNQIHSLISNSSKHILCIFSTDLVSAYSQKIKKSVPCKNVFKVSENLVELLGEIDKNSPVIEKKGMLYSLCAQFDKEAEYLVSDSAEKGVLYSAFDYVEENFQKECTLKELSEKSGYSYSYISRCFKKTTGTSFNNYVNQFRIRKACYLLSNTNATVLQCAMDSGYTSLRTFNRNFYDLLKVTPTEYKNKEVEKGM